MRCVVCVSAAVLAAFAAPSVHAQSNDPGTLPEELRWLVVPALGGDADAKEEGVSVERLHTAAEALRQELVVRGRSVWRADNTE